MKIETVYLKLSISCIFWLSSILFSGNALGAIIYVPAEQPTIQAGIDAAFDGDTVMVADGTYTGDGNKILDFGGKAITLKSENGPANCIIDGEWVYSPTNVPLSGRGFYFHNGERQDSIVEGFTIVRFSFRAILCENSSPAIISCVFADNISWESGAAIFNSGPSTTITNCKFSDNHELPGDWIRGGAIDNIGGLTVIGSSFTDNYARIGGGAIYNSGVLIIAKCAFLDNGTSDPPAGGGGAIANTGSLTITNSTFIANYGGPSGGAIDTFSDSAAPSAIISGCTFSGNETWITGEGGAISIDNSAAIITNCDFRGNRGADGGAIFTNSSTIITNCTFTGNLALLEDEVSGGAITASNATITNCILWDNRSFDGSQIVGDPSTVVTYSDIEGGYAGTGNIDADPSFVDPGYWDDGQFLEFHWDDRFRSDNGPPDNHLQMNSPCIDAGTSENAPDTDFEGDSRPEGSGYDIGADEYVLIDDDNGGDGGST